MSIPSKIFNHKPAYCPSYKTRLLKVIKDYKKYGAEPGKMQSWVPRLRQGFDGRGKTRNSTPLLIKKDKPDKNKIVLSNLINTTVENYLQISLSLERGKVQISLPKDITHKEIKIIKNILDSIVEKD